jgi:E3 ubiquitin-protein ligase HERC3
MRWCLVVVTGCRLGFGDLSQPDAAIDAPAIDANLNVKIVQAQLGVNTTCVLSDDGRVLCWGDNTWGKLGIPSSDPSPRGDAPGELAQLSPLDFGSGAKVEKLFGTIDYACALLTDHRVKCWGNDDGSQLGDNDISNHRGDADGEMGDGLPATVIAGGGPFDFGLGGHYHTCLSKAGQVWCFGLNDEAQNGNGSTDADVFDQATLGPVDFGSFVPVEMAATFNSSCARDAAGHVKCWGDGGGGVLGSGGTAQVGNAPGEMGDALPFVPLGAGVVALEISAGWNHVCAITNLGVVCWGAGVEGGLGTGNQDDVGSSPNQIASATPLDLGAPATQIAEGDSFTCARLADGSVTCFGKADQGQLCTGATDDRGDDPGELGASLRVPLPEPAVSVATGKAHACVVLESGAIACWGNNAYGQLGAGDTQNRGDDPGELPVVLLATDLSPNDQNDPALGADHLHGRRWHQSLSLACAVPRHDAGGAPASRISRPALGRVRDPRRARLDPAADAPDHGVVLDRAVRRDLSGEPQHGAESFAAR